MTTEDKPICSKQLHDTLTEAIIQSKDKKSAGLEDASVTVVVTDPIAIAKMLLDTEPRATWFRERPTDNAPSTVVVQGHVNNVGAIWHLRLVPAPATPAEPSLPPAPAEFLAALDKFVSIMDQLTLGDVEAMGRGAGSRTFSCLEGDVRRWHRYLHGGG